MLCGCEGEGLGSAGWSEVAVVGDGVVAGERLEDLACDGAFEGAENGADRPALLEMPVAASREAVSVGAARGDRDRCGSVKRANDADERSRSGLSPAVINSRAPMTGPTPLIVVMSAGLVMVVCARMRSLVQVGSEHPEPRGHRILGASLL